MSQQPAGGFRYTLGGWSPKDAITAAEATLEQLRNFGVKVPAENRLAKARALVEQAETLNVQLGPSDWSMELALAEANRTIFEHYVIVRGLSHVDETARKKLGRMLRGSATPEESRDDHARDEQAEFFTAALLCGAGFRVDLGGPDLLLTRHKTRIGVAVKRVKSDKQFAKRVMAAERQLEKDGLYGFIVVNAALFLMRLYRSNRSADLSAALWAKTNEWISILDLEKANTRVLAVIGLATSFTHVGSGGRALAFNLHFHPQFIVESGSAAEQNIRQTIETMGRSMSETVRRSMGV